MFARTYTTVTNEHEIHDAIGRFLQIKQQRIILTLLIATATSSWFVQQWTTKLVHGV